MKVSTLVDGEVEPGKHRLQFDGSHLPAGVYFYRIHTGNFVQTRKMVLLK
ncbi:MAG: T9SS type A sorting domain-containing protein [Calditrichaeota bacterium]|nr:T9SS type A sorting domain-containing protein [Calditrichota bacterium]